jgi:tetratricopeptide (TPR) repeat protein
MSKEINEGDIALIKGIREFQDKQYSAAEASLQSAIKHYESAKSKKEAIPDQNYATAYKALGLALNANNKPVEAIKVFQAAVTKGIKEFDIYNNLGFAYLKNSAYPNAIGFFTEALQIKSDSYSATYNLGFAHQAAGNHSEALDVYKKALTLTKNPEQRLDISSKIIESALAQNMIPVSLHPELQAAYEYVRPANLTKASPETQKNQAKLILQQYYMSCVATQQDGGKMSEISELYKTVGEKPLEEIIFNAIKEMKPSNSTAAGNILKMLSYMTEYDKSTKLEDIKGFAVHLIKQYPSCGKDLYKIANSKLKDDLVYNLKNHDGTSTDKNEGYLKLLEGYEKYDKKDFQGAVKNFNAAIKAFEKLDKSDIYENMKSVAYKNLGQMYFTISEQSTGLGIMLDKTKALFTQSSNTAHSNSLTLAVEAFKEALKFSQEEKNSDIHNALGCVYFRQRNFEEAKNSFINFVKDNNDNFVAHYHLGRAYQELSDLKKAIKSFETAKELNSKDFNTLFNLAECLQKTRAHEEAMKEFQQALALPEAKSTSEMLNIHCKIIECAQELPKNSPHLESVTKQAFGYVSYNIEQTELLKFADQVKFILLNRKTFITVETNTQENVELRKLYDIVNPYSKQISGFLAFIGDKVNVHKESEGTKLTGENNTHKDNDSSKGESDQ